MVEAVISVGRIASWASCAPLDWVWNCRGLLYLSPHSWHISSLLPLIHNAERLTESVRMYVILPFSYKCWAIVIVWDTVNPNLRAASCCNVDVVKGGAGERFNGFLVTASALNSACWHLSRKASTSSRLLNLAGSSAFTSDIAPSLSSTAKMAFIL